MGHIQGGEARIIKCRLGCAWRAATRQSEHRWLARPHACAYGRAL